MQHSRITSIEEVERRFGALNKKLDDLNELGNAMQAAKTAVDAMKVKVSSFMESAGAKAALLEAKSRKAETDMARFDGVLRRSDETLSKLQNTEKDLIRDRDKWIAEFRETVGGQLKDGWKAAERRLDAFFSEQRETTTRALSKMEESQAAFSKEQRGKTDEIYEIHKLMDMRTKSTDEKLRGLSEHAGAIEIHAKREIEALKQSLDSERTKGSGLERRLAQSEDAQAALKWRAMALSAIAIALSVLNVGWSIVMR